MIESALRIVTMKRLLAFVLVLSLFACKPAYVFGIENYRTTQSFDDDSTIKKELSLGQEKAALKKELLAKKNGNSDDAISTEEDDINNETSLTGQEKAALKKELISSETNNENLIFLPQEQIIAFSNIDFSCFNEIEISIIRGENSLLVSDKDTISKFVSILKTISVVNPENPSYYDSAIYRLRLLSIDNQTLQFIILPSGKIECSMYVFSIYNDQIRSLTVYSVTDSMQFDLLIDLINTTLLSAV